MTEKQVAAGLASFEEQDPRWEAIKTVAAEHAEAWRRAATDEGLTADQRAHRCGAMAALDQLWEAVLNLRKQGMKER